MGFDFESIPYKMYTKKAGHDVWKLVNDEYLPVYMGLRVNRHVHKLIKPSNVFLSQKLTALPVNMTETF